MPRPPRPSRRLDPNPEASPSLPASLSTKPREERARVNSNFHKLQIGKVKASPAKDKKNTGKDKSDRKSKSKSGKENKDAGKKGKKDEYTGVMPKRALSGYTIYFQSRVGPLTKDGTKVSAAMQQASAEWAKLDDKAKEKFTKLAEADKKRYQAQLDDIEKKGFFVMEDGSKSSDHAPKVKKDKDGKKDKSGSAKKSKDKAKPKKANSAYIFFTSDKAKSIAEEKGCAYTEAMKECGRLWNEMDEKAKTKYVKLAEQDKERAERQMEEYSKKGYYTMDDGKKSSILNTEGKSSKSRKSKPVKVERSRKSSSKSKAKDAKGSAKKGKKAVAAKDEGEDISD